ncbi:hypothetical protein AURDEDRAFT_156436 [Auricularia subglabra TFB-10046 SS5]|nr:hypothetical protein AURDEDRAFT_156436 [Auricularia subglabra TFB-10046 SS5]
MRLSFIPVVLCSLINAALAVPSRVAQLSSMPSNAVKIAHDIDKNVFITFDRDGNLLGELPVSASLSNLKRTSDATGTCATISAADIQKLPGWGALHDSAADNWGGDWDTVDANPKDYPDRGAEVCVSGDVTSQETGGDIVGTDGTISLQAAEGTTSETTVTVTKESSLAVGASISATVGIPEIAEGTAELTSTVTLTNSLSTANAISSTNEQTQTITINHAAGQTCHLTFSVQTCDATGRGQQRMVATGWVWFYYGSRRDGHYQWAIYMDYVLSDDEQRATYIGFTTLTHSNTKSTYQANCA